MLKSKHSGWTWEMKRTPYGGGGNFLSSIDPSQAIGNAFAKADPGPAIGKGLSEVDTFVNREIPGGWYTVGALAAGGTALYFAPEIMATIGAEAGTAITTEAGKEAFFAALANGAASTDAIATGLAAETAAGGSGFVAANELMGPTYGELGITGVEGGFAGPTYGELGFTGLNQGEAISAADAASQMASLKQGLSTAKDVYSNVNRAKQLADLISGGGKPNAQQFAQFQQGNQPAQEQFGGLYRMNQNPFAQAPQPTSTQAPMGETQDFLAQLSEQGKTQPTLADLLRNA
jgi:hypothetical protein